MNILIMSDIHGNLEAIRSVMIEVEKYNISKIVLLGDLIDYGPHSNEVIEILNSFQDKVICNIWGNHEHAIITEEYSHFSSQRGKDSAKYTRSILNAFSWKYIKNIMKNSGKYEFEIDGKKCLAIHGSLIDEYWKAIKPQDDLSSYESYDYVFSGHSHLPHVFANYYTVDDAKYRNKKRTMFVNTGSVGQPRNHNPRAQFVIWNTETDAFYMCSVEYDIIKEQESFTNIDDFYRDRLTRGV